MAELLLWRQMSSISGFQVKRIQSNKSHGGLWCSTIFSVWRQPQNNSLTNQLGTTYFSLVTRWSFKPDLPKVVLPTLHVCPEHKKDNTALSQQHIRVLTLLPHSKKVPGLRSLHVLHVPAWLPPRLSRDSNVAVNVRKIKSLKHRE